jgi:hypothetical protein
MKLFNTFILLLFLSPHLVSAQQHYLQNLWVTDTIIPVPESVLYSATDKFLYVSLIDGLPAERDGKGGIAKLNTTGNIINLNWITGLNAPKGMARYKNTLFVADLTELVMIDILQNKVVRKITIDSAKVLNDVTVDGKGTVYVSDPRAKKIFKVKNDVPTIHLENLVKPNGLKFIDGFLYMLDNGTLYKIDKQKNKQIIAEGMDDNTDGIEPVKKGEYIVSCWTGVLYYVKENGEKQMLRDTRKEEYYLADIGYNAKENVIYIPSLFKMTVSAYKLITE